jgi:hypothetical protein
MRIPKRAHKKKKKERICIAVKCERFVCLDGGGLFYADF